MEHARPPTELQIEGSPAVRADAWRKWWKQFEVFLKASGVNKEPTDVQASLLVNLIGAEGYEVFSTFTYTKDENADDIECLRKKFDEYFGTKMNITMLRFKFFSRNQHEGETIGQYVTALKLLSKDCEFEHLVDSLIRDRIVCGVSNGIVRDRLLRCGDLTFAKAVQICEADEISREERQQIEVAGGSQQVDAVVGRDLGRRGFDRGAAGARAPRRGGIGGGRWSGRSGGARDPCKRCGRVYCDNGPRCPAVNMTCFVCNGRGHFARVCSNKISGKQVYNVNVEFDNRDDSDQSENIMYVNMIKSTVLENDEWLEYIDIKGERIKFKLDSGANLNVINKFDFERLKVELVPYNKTVLSYTGHRLPVVGQCTLHIKLNNETYEVRFVVVDLMVKNILGLKESVRLGFIKRIDSIDFDTYGDLFQGLGELPGLHKITIDKSVQPVICPTRRVPLGLRDKLFSELKRMERLGVVRKVNHPTEWVNGIVIAAKKNGDIRVCLDPRALNRAVKRAHFPLPTVSELAARLRGARFFSVLDARSGFWMLRLDESSADLCTFNTPFGRYQFLRLPYGINCAPEIFHAKIRQLLEDLDGTDSFIDDIVVWGSSRDEHDVRLQRLLQRARNIGIKFNKEKCKFGLTQIVYLGHIFDERGMRPDEAKIKAIVDLPNPDSRKSLERFLGMVNYLSKFIPNYSQSVNVLRNLLKKNSEWLWDHQHTKAVELLKQKITNAPVLALYSCELPVLLSVDASSVALGAVLLQNGRPVEFASLTLNDTQCRYAQIEKEMLAIVFACERFHQYIFSRSDVKVQTDHKPLESIFKKSLADVPARLQRMMLRVQAYNIEVIYTPGKYMYIADTLSRGALPELMHEKMNEEVEAQTCFMLENVQFSSEKLRLVEKHTANDELAQILIKYITKGWPRRQYEIDTKIRIFWQFRDSLQYIYGVIYKGDLVYIPISLRGEMLERIHEGHLGVDKCRRRAREIMFWPGMSQDIDLKVRECKACALFASSPPRQPLQPHSIPNIPWYKLGSDIFEYNKKYYLILVDYFSSYVEVNELNSIGSRSVITAMKEQFSRHGIPDELVTDNGPAYSSREFRVFLREWEIKHITSSPMYPQSNGKSERTIRTVKNLLKKCLLSGQDYYLSLLNFRTTPRDNMDSPAQILMGRRLNTRLPMSSSLLLQQGINTKKNYEAVVEQQKKQKRYYDQKSKDLPPLHCNDKVVVSDGAKRKFMTVVKPSSEPRSYILQDAVGRKYRRNRRHIIRRQTQAGGTDSYKHPVGTSLAYPANIVECKREGQGQSAYPSETGTTLPIGVMTRSKSKQLLNAPVSGT